MCTARSGANISARGIDTQGYGAREFATGFGGRGNAGIAAHVRLAIPAAPGTDTGPRKSKLKPGDRLYERETARNAGIETTLGSAAGPLPGPTSQGPVSTQRAPVTPDMPTPGVAPSPTSGPRPQSGKRRRGTLIPDERGRTTLGGAT